MAGARIGVADGSYVMGRTHSLIEPCWAKEMARPGSQDSRHRRLRAVGFAGICQYMQE